MSTPKVYLVERKRRMKNGAEPTYYVLRWSDTEGRLQQTALGRAKKSGGTVTRSEADRRRRELEQQISGGTLPQNKPRRISLSNFVEYHEDAEGFDKRPSTLTEWRTAGKHATNALGDVPLESLTAASVGRIRKYLDGKGRSPATIRKTLGTLRAMLNSAKRHGLVSSNPFTGQKLGDPPAKVKRIYTETEVESLTAAAPSLWWRTLIQLAYTSGLRKAEMLHLRWSDIDAGCVRVQAREASRYTIGDADVPVFAWKPKTAQSARMVPIPPQTAARLVELEMETDGSPYVFVDLGRLSRLDAKQRAGELHREFEIVGSTNWRFRKIQDDAAAALDDENWRRGTIHDLRKSFATRAAGAGVPMIELHRHMGHSSMATTAKYYTDVEVTAADRLRQVFA